MSMVKRVWYWLSPILLVLAMSLCFAGPVLAAFAFYVPVTVYNNSTTTYTNLPIVVTINSTQLNQQGYITNTALGTAWGQTGDNNYLGVYNTKLGFFEANLPAGRSTVYNYWLGWTPARSFHYMLPGLGGNITAADSAALEPAATDLQVDWVGYVNTSETGALVAKIGGYGLATNSDGKVYAYVVSSVGPSTENLLPDASGSYTNVPTQFPAATFHWDKVDDPVGAPDDDATYVGTTAGGPYYWDSYSIADTAIPKGSWVSSVQAFMRVKDTGGGAAGWATTGLRVLGTEGYGTERQPGGAYVSYTEALAKPGGSFWAWEDLNSLQVLVGLKSNDIRLERCTQTYVIVNYYPSTPISANVASGYHAIRLIKSGVNMDLYVDNMGAPVASTGAAPANIYNSSGGIYQECQPGRYTESAKVTINAAEVLSWKPVTLAATVPDLSGNGNTGTINWGTNPSGVEVSVGGVLSASTYVAPGSNGTVVPATMFVPPTGIILYENKTKDYSGMPIYPIMAMGASSLGMEVTVLYGIMMFITSMVMGMAFFLGTGSATMGVIALGATFGYAASTGILGFWVPLIVGLICLLLVAVLRGM